MRLFSLAGIPCRLAYEAPKLPLWQEGVVHPDRLRRFTYLQLDLSHLGLYMFSLFSNIRTLWVPRFDLIRLPLVGQSPLCLQQGPVWGEPLPVTTAFDDDLIAGVGQLVESAVAEEGILGEAQPLVHSAVAGGDEAGGPVPVED